MKGLHLHHQISNNRLKKHDFSTHLLKKPHIPSLYSEKHIDPKKLDPLTWFAFSGRMIAVLDDLEVIDGGDDGEMIETKEGERGSGRRVIEGFWMKKPKKNLF